jgi:hypothetical protein
MHGIYYLKIYRETLCEKLFTFYFHADISVKNELVHHLHIQHRVILSTEVKYDIRRQYRCVCIVGNL